MKIILKYLHPQMRAMCAGLAIKIIGTVSELLLPWMLSVILDEFVPRKDINSIVPWGLLMIVCAAGALISNIIANRMATRVARNFIRKVRSDLFAKITDLSCTQSDRFTVSSIISRLTSDSYNLHQMVDRMQRLGVRAPILLLGCIIVTFAMEPVLTLVMVAVLPLLVLIVVLVSRKGIVFFTRTQSALDAMICRAQESILGIRVIRALSKEEYEKKRFNTANVTTAAEDYRATMLTNITNPSMNFLLNAGLTLVVVVGAFRVNDGHTSTGTIVAFLSYFTIMLTALMMVSRMFIMLSKGVASGKRIAEVLSEPADMDILQLSKQEDDSHIRFDNVSFSYSKVRENLKNISFALKQGETLGVIGATGSGKSTLLQLALRFYDPDQGAIYLNGRDLRTIPDEILYTRFGVVFQNDFLYGETISENIDLGRGLTEEQIYNAAQTAQADFIEKRKDGYSSTIASGGVDLSGGQKQRLLIARALAADPEILLLDDSSSALDYKTDAALRRALKKGFSNTTKIIIAQRVSSIQGADKILVLDDSREIGYGTHEQLMEQCATYRDIVVFQMQEAE